MWNTNIKKFTLLLFSVIIFTSCAKDNEIEPDPDDEKIVYVEPLMIKTVDLLFTGSSTIDFWPNLTNTFRTYTLINTGASGTALDELIKDKENRIFKYNPTYFILYYGDNDIYRFSVDTYIKIFRRLMKEFKMRRPHSTILLISIKPSPHRVDKFDQYMQINNYLKKFHEINSSCQYIDIWTPMMMDNEKVDTSYFKEDKLHLSEKGYALMSKLVLAKIKELEAVR